MNKVAIVFYSGTGNTELMASSIAQGVENKLGEVKVFSSSEFNESLVDEFQAIAFGCPASGAENLEETEFQPMFDEVLPKLKGKNISLFGSYGWGDGQWMRDWEEVCLANGANMACDYVICVETPDGEALEACRHMGEVLAIVR